MLKSFPPVSKPVIRLSPSSTALPVCHTPQGADPPAPGHHRGLAIRPAPLLAPAARGRPLGPAATAGHRVGSNIRTHHVAVTQPFLCPWSTPRLGCDCRSPGRCKHSNSIAATQPFLCPWSTPRLGCDCRSPGDSSTRPPPPPPKADCYCMVTRLCVCVPATATDSLASNTTASARLMWSSPNMSTLPTALSTGEGAYLVLPAGTLSRYRVGGPNPTALVDAAIEVSGVMLSMPRLLGVLSATGLAPYIVGVGVELGAGGGGAGGTGMRSGNLLDCSSCLAASST